MNPKVIFSFIIGLGIGLFLGYILTDLHTRKSELTSATSPHGAMGSMTGGMMGDENPHASGDNPQMDNVMETIHSLENILAKDPKNYDALINLGNLYYDANMFGKALGYYRQARVIRDDNPDLLTDLGTCYRQTGNLTEAMKCFDLAVKNYPSHWHSLFNACVVSLYDLKDKKQAKVYYDKLVKIAPKEVDLTSIKKDLGLK